MAKGAVKATVVKFEVYALDDAAKLVKEGIKIGGKVRVVEEFRGQPRTVPAALRNAPTGPRNHGIPKSGQCLGCPSYRNGAISHTTQACPLRNGTGYRTQERKRSSIGTEYPQAEWPRTNVYYATK